MDVVQSVYVCTLPSKIVWKSLHDFFILVLSLDLSTVREFLLKQTQLKCFTIGGDEVRTKHTKDMFDTVKVLKCYSGMST